MTVFERSSSGVRATEAGRNFLRLARSILEQTDTLVIDAHRAGRGETGQISIGFFTSLSAGNLRSTIVDFSRRFPEIAFNMIESSRARLVTALRRGAIDLAIVTGETPLLDGKFMALWSERIFLVSPESHRLVGNDSIRWTDLGGETLCFIPLEAAGKKWVKIAELRPAGFRV